MSASTPIEPAPLARAWQLRAARHEDADGVAAAVGELLAELGASPPPASAMRAAARALLEDDEAGAVLVAEAAGALVGVLAASWQTAIHAPGRYALIQDLWVSPEWRSRRIGGELLAALLALARERRIAYVEVGLPRDRFANLHATRAFYAAGGFTPLGTRMRRSLT